MILTRKIGNNTEIYVEGGGLITLSFPTNFHEFWTKKLLDSKDSIDNYKEITQQEKEELELLDSKWIEPSKEFIARFNNKCALHIKGLNFDDRYNEKTGFFQLNGILDITLEQAIPIVDSPDVVPNVLNMLIYHHAMRTNFCAVLGKGVSPMWNRSFQGNTIIEVAVTYGTLQTEVFDGCKRLHTAYIRFLPSQKFLFTGCQSLENIKFCSYLKSDLNNHAYFHECPKLTYQSVYDCVDKRNGTNDIIYYMHPDVYNKIVDESNEEWHSLIAFAESKNITFSTL